MYFMYNCFEVVIMAKTRRNFYIDDDLYEEFKRMTAINGHSMANVISECMKEYNSLMRMTVAGMSAEELLDYKVYKVKMQLDRVIDVERSED